MRLRLIREPSRDGVTHGSLYLDGVRRYETLEDEIRDGPKVPGKTAIPAGTYLVVLSFSPKFKRILPEVLDVPHFTGIRIHSGNTAEDTEGCILVGRTRYPLGIGESQLAFADLYERLKASPQPHRLTIEDPV